MKKPDTAATMWMRDRALLNQAGFHNQLMRNTLAMIKKLQPQTAIERMIEDTLNAVGGK